MEMPLTLPFPVRVRLTPSLETASEHPLLLKMGKETINRRFPDIGKIDQKLLRRKTLMTVILEK